MNAILSNVYINSKNGKYITIFITCRGVCEYTVVDDCEKNMYNFLFIHF